MTSAAFETVSFGRDPVVETVGLRKTYGRRVALESLDLDVCVAAR